MAVLALHAPGRESPRAKNLGNYIDLSTEQVTLFESEDVNDALAQLRDAVRRAPKGAILATGVNDMSLPIRVAFVGEQPTHGDVSHSRFQDWRFEFDLTRFEDTGWGTPVSDLHFERIDLADPDLKIYPGTRMILRFRSPAGNPRFFRLLIHPGRSKKGATDVNAFRDQTTRLQFEELEPRRLIVPLGIEVDDEDKVTFKTSEKIPAHFISARTRSLRWSIRPSDSRFEGTDYFNKFYPVAMVNFGKRLSRPGVEPEVFEDTSEIRPLPLWVGAIQQRHVFGRTYMNNTLEIFFNDGERPRHSEWSEKVEKYQPHYGPREVWTTQFKYELQLIDGMNAIFVPYDPPMDVEDEH